MISNFRYLESVSVEFFNPFCPSGLLLFLKGFFLDFF